MVDYAEFIKVTAEHIICKSPTPELETYHEVKFSRRATPKNLAAQIRAARAAVSAQLISPAFGQIQEQALEAAALGQLH